MTPKNSARPTMIGHINDAGVSIVCWLSAGACIGLCMLATACNAPDNDTQTGPGNDTTTQPTLTYYQDIQPIYEKHCGFCHSGCSPDGCAGNSCFASYYEALLYPAPVCNGDMNMADCGLYRIEFTKTSVGPHVLKLVGEDNTPIIVPDEDIATIAQWISQGMPVGTPPPPPDAGCVPDCTGKECGCDGCGGLCEGECDVSFYCQHTWGTCSISSGLQGVPPDSCKPNCLAKVCGGEDGCAGECPVTCAGTCNPETGECENCTPVCEGKMCGSDQCGGLCPYLCEEQPCDQQTGVCISDPNCTPDCTDKECGSDGCGGDCPNLCTTELCNPETGQCNPSTS